MSSFDRVDHDILIDRLRRKVPDPGIIRLVRAYLRAGIVDGETAIARTSGSSALNSANPCGGRLSGSSAFAAAIASRLPSRSRCDGPTLVTMPIWGRAISQSVRISPRAVVPLAIDSASRFLYAANVTAQNQVAVYSITPGSGVLSLLGSPIAAGILPGSIVLDPSGQFAYVANDNSNDISVYAVDTTTGALTPASGSPFAAGNQPRSIAID